MNKKGQVTFYVVIGIVAVASLVLVLTFGDILFRSDWEKQRQEALVIPENVKAVQDFVLDCVEETGKSGLTLLGLQGGYINLPSDPIPPISNNPFSNTLRIFPNQDFQTVYWFYKSANGIMKVQVPTNTQMEEELVTYMNQNLGRCTLNFTLFEEFNITVEGIESEVEILDDRVLFTVNYPVHISVNEFNFNFPNFYQDVSSNFGKLYRLSTEMFKETRGSDFLEEFTIDILSVNEEIPFSGTEQSCAPKFWNVDGVEKALRNGLALNIPHIKVKGSDFLKRSDYFVWDIPVGKDDIHIGFRYAESWPLHMEVYPSEGGILTAEPLSQPNVEEMAYVSSFLCLIDYNFIYDIVYPVLFTVSDNDGTLFQYATHVIIDNNQPRENLLGDEAYPDDIARICKAAITPVNVYAVDNDNAQFIDKANIDLKCVSTVCELGTTGLNQFGEAVLSAQSPACVNAQLTGEKEGYHKGRVLVDTTEPGIKTVFMDKYRELSYSIKMVEESGYVRDPESTETVVITLNEDSKKHSLFLDPELDKNKIKLIPGLYKVNARVAIESSEGFYIEGKKFDKCVETPKTGILGIFFNVKEEHCYSGEVPGVTLDQVVNGGTQFDWPLTSTELDSVSKVIFYVPVREPPRTQDELLKVQENVENAGTIIFPELIV